MESTKKNGTELIVLLTIIIFGTILRFYDINRNSLWFDEIGQVVVATQNIPDLLIGVSTHLSPPLDYLIMHFFLKLFPHTELFIRMPAAIFGIGSILLIFFIGKQLFSTKVGLISAFVLAISPFAIYYSQEARMYSSFLFFTLLSFYAFIKFIKYLRNWDILLWIFSGILLIYTHYFGFFVLLAQFIFLLFDFIILRIRNANLQFILKFILGFIVIGLSFLEWLNIFLIQTLGGSQILWYGMNDNWKNFFIIPFIFSGFWWHSFKIASIIILTVIISIGFIYSLKKYLESIVLLIIWILLPLILIYSLTVIRGPMTTDRNLIFILPGLIILLSVGLLNASEIFDLFIKRKIKLNINYGLPIVLLLIVFLTLPNLLDNYKFEKEDWRGVGIYLTEKSKPDDNIIILGGPSQYVNFYYKGNAIYANPNTIEEFISYMVKPQNSMATGCTWVFISGYSNVFWDMGQDNNTNKSMIIKILNTDGKKINGLYNSFEDSGLYQICNR